ncbi:OsmC family protein [Evansella cellulosilytica]|uniref:OsmC family protein n=1 Tax=Evansella cellulosilytica (strain ATCC 21833 / DSM 2522 / FERM P-1141 / JCM 9156 / N-4) TaxID=649639 RepID=E6U0M9_EVAC2|nr:OsmC family protein [Evansella cellulosilytica]ADU29077.1 OsmC family protein [Evansella cellulosilytica DSM 2522]
MKFHMKENGFETTFEYGTLQISGNEEYGFRPYQLMVSSVAVCGGGVLRKVLEKQRMNVKDITVEANVTRDPDAANKITKIHLHYTIDGENLNEAKIEKAMVLAQKNCPMAQTIIDSVELTESFTLV